MKQCSKESCNNPHHAKTYCLKHYIAHWRSQQPKITKETNPRIHRLVAQARYNERKRLIRKIQRMPIHLIRWEVINHLEGTK